MYEALLEKINMLVHVVQFAIKIIGSKVPHF